MSVTRVLRLCGTSPGASARCRSSSTCRSTWRRASSSRSWAATAPARARCSTSSPACGLRRRARWCSRERPLEEWTAIERARLLAHLPQSLRADLSMLAEALVLMGRYPHADRWFESDEDRRIAEEAMQRCDCLEFRRRALATLSGGERQRVLLAACLAQRAAGAAARRAGDVSRRRPAAALLQRPARRGRPRHRVPGGDPRRESRADVLHAADRARRARVARDLPAESALDDPAVAARVLRAPHRRTTAASRPWVRYQ